MKGTLKTISWVFFVACTFFAFYFFSPYFPDAGSSIAFTAEARAETPAVGREQTRRIRVVDDSSYAPFIFLDANKKPAGIVVDIWRLWSRKTGIPVEFQLMPWHSALAAVENGTADATDLFDTPDRSRIFAFVKPLCSISTGIFFSKRIHGIKNIDDLQGFPVGVVKDDSADGFIRRQYPNAPILEYQSIEALIKAALHGEINVFVADSEVSRFYLAKLDKDNVFRECATPVETNWLYVGTRKDDAAVISLLRQGFDRISPQEIQAVIDSWTGKPVMSRIPTSAISFAAALLLLAITLTVLWNISLRKKVGQALDDLNERNRKLQESENRFLNLFESAPVPMAFAVEKDGFWATTWNESWYRVFGYSPEEAQNHSGNEIGLWCNPDDRKRFVDQVKQQNHVEGIEVLLRRRDGSVRSCEVFGRFIGNTGQQVLAAAYLDITARKEAEKALRESEERFSKAFHSSPAPMSISYTDSGKIIDVNEKLLQTIEYSREEIIGRTSFELGFWKQAETRINLGKKLKEIGFLKEEPIVFASKSGKIRHGLWSAEIVNLAGTEAMLSLFYDFTDRKRAEDALKESQERFSKAFSSSPAPSTISDIATGKYINVNDQWIKMLGYSRQEAIGRTSYDLQIWKDREIRARMIEELEHSGSFREKHVQFINKSGEVRDVLWSAEIINLAGAKVMLSLFYDFTERRKAEDEKARLQSQLVQSQKMEAVGRLAGGLAHDYNNMLGVIMGHTELALLKSQENDAIRNHLVEITNAAKRSSELTQQLLAFARRQTISPKVVNLNEAITSTLQMLKVLIGEDITLTWIPGTEGYQVNIDPSQLDQVLVNLTVNARDAINGIGRITIETQRAILDESSCRSKPYFVPGNYAVVIVSDSGCGMDEETQAKIFEPFYTTKGIGKGTGLGLATVYGIVKQNSGFINVYSERGRGTTFKIYLPSCHDIPAAHREDREIEQTCRGETILIVEDEDALLKVNSTMLSDLGYTVLVAGSPSEAISLGNQHAGAIDLLMTDVIMPQMNGREIHHRLIENNPNMKCLFTSGYTANVISHHGVLDDGVHFLQKPFTLNQLAKKLRECLSPHFPPTV